MRERALEFGQFRRVRQVIVMQQMHDFLERDFAGELVDVVAAINQLADVALDIAQARLRGDDAFQAFARCCRGVAHAVVF